MPRNRFVEGQRLQVPTGLVLRIVRAEEEAARPAPVLGRRHPLSHALALLKSRVRLHDDVCPGHGAEPARHPRLGARQRRPGVRQHLVARAKGVLAVAPHALEQRTHVPSPKAPLGDRPHLGLELRDGGATQPVNRIGRQREPGRRSDARAIAGEAIGIRRHADRLAGVREVLLRQEVPIAAHRRSDVRLDDAPQLGAKRGR